METFELEDMVTEVEANASAIKTLALEVSDGITAGDDTDKLHAIVKLAEDQLRLTKEMSERMTTM